MTLRFLQLANPPFKLSHTGDTADTNFIMMVDRGPSMQLLLSVLASLQTEAFAHN